MERYNQRLLIKFEIFQRIDGDDEIDSDYNKETNEEPRRRRSHGGQRGNEDPPTPGLLLGTLRKKKS